MDVLIIVFSLWDPVSFSYEVTDVIDSHSHFCGLWTISDVDDPPDAKAYPHGHFLMEQIIPLFRPQWYGSNSRREPSILKDCASGC